MNKNIKYLQIFAMVIIFAIMCLFDESLNTTEQLDV